MAIPSSPERAKGLLLSPIEDPDPLDVVVYEAMRTGSFGAEEAARIAE